IPATTDYYAPSLPEFPSADATHRGNRLQKTRCKAVHVPANIRRTRLSTRRVTTVPSVTSSTQNWSRVGRTRRELMA
ncbi:MAG: hypothetical protein M3518_11735, partial [Actinomycetota bacterium]|nr:hypothetical protein [Actinomycetota bacterium]